MKIKVALFAVARDTVGEQEIEIELTESPTVRELKRALGEQYPELKPIVVRSMISVDHQYAVDDSKLEPNSEVGLIPPVSGG